MPRTPWRDELMGPPGGRRPRIPSEGRDDAKTHDSACAGGHACLPRRPWPMPPTRSRPRSRATDTVAEQMSAERSPEPARRPDRARRAAGRGAWTCPARASGAACAPAPTGEIRARIRRLERRLHAPPAPTASPVLEAIAACESGGNPSDRHRQRLLRQIPVHALDVGRGRRLRQPGARLRGRAGPPRRDPLRAVRPVAVARVRASSLRRAMDAAAFRAEFPVLQRSRT